MGTSITQIMSDYHRTRLLQRNWHPHQCHHWFLAPHTVHDSWMTQKFVQTPGYSIWLGHSIFHCWACGRGEHCLFLQGLVLTLADKMVPSGICGSSSMALTPALNCLLDSENQTLLDKEAALFHHNIAKLLFLCKRVRPDILMAVIFVCSRVKRPRHS
jgi:hypothetical protein